MTETETATVAVTVAGTDDGDGDGDLRREEGSTWRAYGIAERCRSCDGAGGACSACRGRGFRRMGVGVGHGD